MSEAERWLPVPGYAGYEVSDLGRVRSVDRTVVDCDGKRSRKLTGKILKPHRVMGYPAVGLYNRETRATEYVHRLVLTAFAGECPEDMEACHGNGNRTDNCLANLRWDSRSENTRDQVRLGIHNKRRCTHCPRGHPLKHPNLVDRTSNKEWRSCLACTRARGSHRGNGDLQAESDLWYQKITAGYKATACRNRTHCPRNHLLIGPNLVPYLMSIGRRSCLACSRVQDKARIARRRGEPFDLQTASDEWYRRIMAGHTTVAMRDRTRCPRSHLLVTPNLVPGLLAIGRRSCLACDRARGAVKAAVRRGEELDFKHTSDQHYERIMSTAAAPAGAVPEPRGDHVATRDSVG